ncbi:MAG: tetratricopeptide repeat protein, partial [Candidatus Dormibacteraceae bacterium]
IGRVHGELTDYRKALEYHQRALNLVERALGAESRSPIRASILDNMGATYFHLGEHRKSLEASLASLAIRTEMFGHSHPAVVKNVSNIAACYLEMGQTHKGYQTIDDCLKVLPKEGEEHKFLKKRRREFESRFQRPGFRQPKRTRR